MKNLKINAWVVAFFSLLSAICLGLFLFTAKSFVHDELTSIQTATSSTWSAGYEAMNHYKPRLLSNAVNATVFRIATSDRTLPIVTSATLHLLALMVFALIAGRRFSVPASALLPLLLALAISRFNLFYYAETNLGVYEGTAHLFFLLSLYFGIKTIQTSRPADGYLTALFILACVLCHERFAISLSGLLVLPVLLWLRKTRKTHCIALAVSLVIALGSFYIASKFIPSPSALYGTSGTPIALQIGQFTEFFLKALVNAIGFNNGEPYLAGPPFSAGRLPFGPLVITLGLATIASLAFAFWKNPQEKASHPEASRTNGAIIAGLLIYVILAAAASSSITFRQEMRWVYAVHLTVALLFCATYRRNLASTLAIVCFSFLTICSNAQALAGYKSIYMIGQGLEHNALIKACESSNIMSGKDVIYCGTAHPGIVRQLPKINSLKVIGTWDELPLSEINEDTVLCEYDHESLRILSPGELSLRRTLDKTPPESLLETVSRNGIRIANPDSADLRSPSTWKHWTVGSTMTGTDSPGEAPAPLMANEYISHLINDLKPNRGYVAIVTIDTPKGMPAEAHLAFDFPRKKSANSFFPFDCSALQNTRIFSFTTPGDLAGAKVSLGHHRLGEFNPTGVYLIEVGSP